MSSRQRIARIAAAAALTSVLWSVTAATVVPWCSITVSTSEGLRDAVETMAPGSTICLQPGTYEAGFTVRQSVTVRGVGSAGDVILQSGEESDTPVLDLHPLYRETMLVRLENLTITGASGGDGYGEQRGDHGLFVDRDVHLLLRNVVCSGNGGAGVYVEEEATLTAYECAFADAMYGVLLAGRCAARLVECTISENGMGVGLPEGGQLYLSDCTISGNTEYGALLVGGQGMIDRCDIVDNAWGLVIGAPYGMPASLEMTDSTVAGSEHVGIALLSSTCIESGSPEGASARVSGEWNSIPGPEDEGGNRGGALCPAWPDVLWPEDFLRD